MEPEDEMTPTPPPLFEYSTQGRDDSSFIVASLCLSSQKGWGKIFLLWKGSLLQWKLFSPGTTDCNHLPNPITNPSSGKHWRTRLCWGDGTLCAFPQEWHIGGHRREDRCWHPSETGEPRDCHVHYTRHDKDVPGGHPQKYVATIVSRERKIVRLNVSEAINNSSLMRGIRVEEEEFCTHNSHQNVIMTLKL